MKHKNELKGLCIIIGLLCSNYINAQQPPTGSANSTITPWNPNNSSYAWFRGGNLPGGGAGTNNIFGTMWNSPIYTVTNGINRMKLNGTFGGATQYTINGFTFAGGVNTSGYLLLGENNNTPMGNPLFSSKGAFSLLHLNGPGSFVQEGGYRPWMKTGVMFTANNDAGWIGLRPTANLDVTDFVINWSDNPGAGQGSQTPDNLVFTFTSFNGNTAPVNDLIGNSVNGREILRMNTNGNIGVGPRFNNLIQPQSTFHIHQENFSSSYLQISNQTMTTPGTQTGPTAITAANGLRLGIVGNGSQAVNGTALLYNQENRHLLFSTNANTNTVNMAAGNTLERMRITSVGAPTSLAGGGFGVWNPANLSNTNLTRVAISHDPTQPIVRPMSLLHLGYNVTGIISPLNGWRPWMDLGIFTSQGTDNIYIGLKKEPSNNPLNQGDRYDAIINWGDNMHNPLLQEGPDNLRFIFTSGVNDPFGTTQSRSVNGVEVMRLTPNNIVNNAQVINKPSVGIGDFTGIPIDSNNYVGATLDVDGDVRIRSVQRNDSLNQILVRDSSDYGRIYWRDINSIISAAINADNGCSMDPVNTNTVQFGQNINAAGNPAQLLNYREVPMNNQNIYFLGQNPTTQGLNAIGIGYPNNVTNLPAKLSVWEDPGQPVAYNTVGVLGRNSSASPALNGPFNYIGVAGVADGVDIPNNKNRHIGGYFSSNGGVINYGIMGLANTGNPNNDNINYGGYFQANANSNNSINYGINAIAGNGQHPVAGSFNASNGINTTTGIEVIAGSTFTTGNCYAGKFICSAVSSSTQYGIYASAPIDPGNSYAGWFEGDVHVNGLFTSSDSIIKHNIQPVNNVSQQLQQLQPVSFQYTNAAVPQLNLSAGNHYGLIAQQVEQVFPELVQNTQVAPVYDSLGQVVHPAATVKSVNYMEIIPLLIGTFQEQQQKIAQQDSMLQALQQQMQLLSGMITNCCNAAQPMQIHNNNTTMPSIQHEYTMEVRLRNEDMIVLNQNAPNPFKEQTTITWYLPERVQRAQLVFTNNLGQVIKMVDIRENGQGRLVVYAEDLSSGMYNYSLIVDGQIVETKRMTKVD